MDKHEELRELDIAEIDAVSGGAISLGWAIQKAVDHVSCVKDGGTFYDNGDNTLCVK